MFRSALLSLSLALTPAAALAQGGPLSPETFHGIADVRLSGVEGERGWLDGGFGKTGLSDGTELTLPRAALDWRPQLGFSVSGHVTVQFQPAVDPALDVNEAYLAWRAPPSPAGRATLKAGIFYPPVSLEHTATAWTTPDMLSASAINSWIGEEVLVGGLEATLRREIGAHEVAATAAVFGWNDTSGTLLSFRGWALHGLTTGLRTDFDLPPLSPFMQPRQAPITTPIFELDNRAGYYGRLEWRPPAPVALSAIYYDNAGDRIAVEDVQWAWETRFFNAGLRWEPDERTTVLAQAMNGETLMGYRYAGHIWVDVGFQAAYLRVTRTFGDHALSGRLDWFATSDRTLQALDDNEEDGWAATFAWRRTLSDHAQLIVEAQHVASDRPARSLAGLAARQHQTALSAALRLGF